MVTKYYYKTTEKKTTSNLFVINFCYGFFPVSHCVMICYTFAFPEKLSIFLHNFVKEKFEVAEFVKIVQMYQEKAILI